MLYFVPQKRANANQVDLKQLGLEYAFEGSPDRRENVGGGLDGTDGTLLAQSGAYGGGRVAIAADKSEQTWQKSGEFWVGYWNDEPPTEESLRRKVQLRGKPFVGASGKTWLVPTAITIDEIVDQKIMYSVLLDQHIQMQPDGTLEYGEVISGLQDLWNVAFDWLMTDTQHQTTVEQLWTAAATVFSHNYRVSAAELSLLQVWSRSNVLGVMDIVVDNTLEFQKKTQGEALTTDAGEPEDCQDTARQ